MSKIRIQRIHIENFMTIKEVSLDIPTGITELLGYNRDSGGSNGAGKSSLLLAVPQCLFNKNPNLGLQQVNNTVTGKPYRIVLTLVVDTIKYTIDNDRNTNKIVVFKDGDVVTTRIKESLAYIESEILNLTYDEFITLTLITAKSLMSIFDITSANLLLKLFNLHKIDEYVNTLKTTRRELNRDLMKLKTTPKTINVSALDKEIKVVTNDLELEADILKAVAEEYSKFDQDSFNSLLHKQSMAKLGVCPTCNQVVNSIDFDVGELSRQLNNKTDLDNRLSEARRKVNTLTSKLQVLEAKRVGYLEVEQTVITDTTREQQELTEKINTINTTLKIIDQGTVHQVYLNQFLLILNSNLLKLQKFNFNITAELINSSIKYKIATDSVHKETVQLSGGEATTVALIILLAIYRTLRQSLGIDINLLILDEAIHMVDETNKKFIATLLKSMNKDIIVVQHEENIDPSILTNKIVISKERGLSTLYLH